MRFVGIALSVFLSSAAFVAAAADADNVLTYLNNLNTNLQTLDSDVKKVQAGVTGISQQLQCGVDTVAVDNLIIATTDAVNNASKFSANDSQRIITVLDQITATANQTIADTIAKNTSFGGLAPIVLAGLYGLRIDQGNLGNAFAYKLDQSVLNEGVRDLNALQNGFAAAIAAYGG